MASILSQPQCVNLSGAEAVIVCYKQANAKAADALGLVSI